MRSLYLGRQNYWVPIERCEDEILIKEGLTSPSIKRTQFPSTLPLASTVHKALLTSIWKSKNSLGQRKYIPGSLG